MKWIRARATRAAIASAAICVVLAAVSAPVALAAGPEFGAPTAQSPLGGPSVFTTPISADAQPSRVELQLTFPGQAFTNIIAAAVTAGSSAGSWTAQATYEGHILPNSLLHYQFRLTDASGNIVLGPSAQLLTVDDRYQWKTVTGPVVRLHWNGGDASFGQRALDIGEKAIANASKLLGVTESDPIDFYIYDDEQAFRAALGEGTRENVAGEAIPEIRTMFGYILPSQINDDWVRVLITHELTHLVFDTATSNIYHQPAHWLNEGLAVYLSEGLSDRWQTDMSAAVSQGTLIPLEGMNVTFGAGDQRFELGYAEGVSALDYFVKTYGEEKLWGLVRSYATGLSDDDAFKQAIGLDVTQFNDAWMKSLGVTVPAEVGPQPGPTGPLPPSWGGAPAASGGPIGGASGVPSATPSQGAINPTPGGVRPTPRPSPAAEIPALPITGSSIIAIALLAVIVIAFIGFLVGRRRRPPPPPPPPVWWGGPPAGSGPPPPTDWDRRP